ncbi:Palmitoyltransferase zdhhc20, partial [Nowakowskiella sp. JEL0078]
MLLLSSFPALLAIAIIVMRWLNAEVILSVVLLVFYNLLFALYIWSYSKVLFTNPGSISLQFLQQFSKPEDISDDNISISATSRDALANYDTPPPLLPISAVTVDALIPLEGIGGRQQLEFRVVESKNNGNIRFSIYCIFVWAFLLAPVITMFSDPSPGAMLRVDIQIIFLFIVAGVFGLCMVPFSGIHTLLILRNKTTIENLEGARRIRGRDGQALEASVNIYDVGTAKNWVLVMGSNPWLWFVPVATSIGD